MATAKTDLINTFNSTPKAKFEQAFTKIKHTDLVQDELLSVCQAIQNITWPNACHLTDALESTLSRPGKLFRPTLHLVAAKASNQGNVLPADIETAAVAELIHTATLLHDDVLDNASLRRGKPTLKHEAGNRIAILSGDYLLAQASLKLSALNNCRLVGIYANVLSDLCQGEIYQMMHHQNIDMPWDIYLEKTRCKTASLFQACGESVGVIHKLPEKHIEHLKTYGYALGMAFQLIDDVLDYTSTACVLGKPALDDLHNGILTAPVLLALQKETALVRAELESDIQKAFENDRDASNRLQTTLIKMGYTHETRLIAEQYYQQACEAISFLPSSVYKTALEQLAFNTIERTA